MRRGGDGKGGEMVRGGGGVREGRGEGEGGRSGSSSEEDVEKKSCF